MSLAIDCPHCGRRSVEEFVYGEIPTVPDAVIDPEERDLQRGFFHENAEGVVSERWFHAFGCRRWLTVRRDTRSDEVVEGA